MPKPGFKTITVPDWIIEEIKKQPDYKGNQAATLAQLIQDAVKARSRELESPRLIKSRILNHLPRWNRNESWELALTILEWLHENEPTAD
ncbi:hypothetical protein H6G96_33755 [Nostoc sp. FACHB-892]|jgi:hypothetical protein|uniref:hypothetical protein n=1 Tax=unclassified Nostoc TaxID=2593658 RepID=UPI0016862F24|nr:MULTISPECIES: hypothetical protein [unclassified Nostoc]MBD2731151.1 hypothetical protein [Nostoc sp. FACHB-892]MDZ8061097.1 hypothetical protein [Nostoc sp. EkiNYC01]MDZ8126713.1 hypothetical protein [Nostoc sp. CmiVER01]